MLFGLAQDTNKIGAILTTQCQAHLAAHETNGHQTSERGHNLPPSLPTARTTDDMPEILTVELLIHIHDEPHTRT